MDTGQDIKGMQQNLEAAFAIFKDQNPELAEAMRVLNISYAEYIQIAGGFQTDPGTTSGNSHTPA
jgi:hypothetical protein